MPTRLANQSAQMLRGALALGMDRQAANAFGPISAATSAGAGGEIIPRASEKFVGRAGAS